MKLYAALCTALYCACVGLQGAGVNVVGPAGPSLASKLRTDVSSVGSILSAEGAGAAAGALLIPLLLGRLPGHIVLCVLSASIGVSLCGVWLCGSVGEVTILYFAVGGLLGSFSGCANTLLAWLHAGRNLGPWVNLVNACFGLGSGGVPLLFVAAERRLGDGLRVFPALGLAAAGVALSAACLPSPPRPKDAKGGGGGGGGGRGRTWVVVGPLMVVLALGVGSEIAFGAWCYEYATARVGMPPTEAAYLTAVYWSSFTCGRLGAVPLAAALPPEGLLLPSLVLEVASALLVLCDPSSERVLWAATVGAGVGVCALYSNVMSLLAGHGLMSAPIVSAMQFACSLGHMTLPNLVALVMRHTSLGHESLFVVLAAANAACLVLVAAVSLHLRRRYKSAPPAALFDAGAKQV
mmetsp:Transcript_42976/g.134791  ORF Transcript_42976/g.134791 Transcript_42976/m.134791 type:complete len:408 (+) Transcript_42976:82-1305(+)